MIEQTVVKHNDRRDRIVRRILRVIQITLGVAAVLGLGFGFTLAGVFWDANRSIFWQAAESMLLLTLPVLLVMAFLEWRIQKLCVEYDYVLSEGSLLVWRISGIFRRLWISVSLDRLTLCCPYDELTDQERKRLSHARFACCNASDPRLCLLEAEDALIGKRRQTVTVLMEPNSELFAALQKSLRRNGR